MLKNKKFLVFFLLLTFATGTLFVVADTNAATGLQYIPLEKIPGTDGLGSDLPGYVLALYKFALIAIILSAVFMLSIGGFFYLTSAGNTSALSTAKSIIFDALIGLVIALVAYLILNVINPDLVRVSINGLSVTPSAPGAPADRPAPAVGQCTNCVPISGIASKPVGTGCAAPGPCQLNESLLTKLNAIRSSHTLRVNEAWPPTVPHNSPCHSNGTCADIDLQNGSESVPIVASTYTAITAAGLSAVYETFKDCAPYRAAGVNCKRFNTTTGSHFHVQ